MMHYLRTAPQKDRSMRPVAACGGRIEPGDKLSGFPSKVTCPACLLLPAVTGRNPAQ